MDLHKSTSQSQLKKALGTLQRVILLVEQDATCAEALQQLASVHGTLRSAEKQLLTHHLEHCINAKLTQDKPAAVRELLSIYSLTPMACSCGDKCTCSTCTCETCACGK